MKNKETIRAKGRHLKEATAKLATNKPKMNEGLAFLIEDALQRSEVVIAAESISEKLQGMAEDLSTIEAKDIMPLNDALTSAFGPQVAQKFNAVATEQIRQLVTAVQTAKSGLDGEILRLKQAVESGEVSDIAMDAGAAAPPGGPPGLADEPPGPAGAPAPDGMPEGPPGPPGEEDMGIPGAAGPAVGRMRKEGAKPKGKRIAELAEPRSHESVNFNTNLSNLQLFHGGAGRLAQGIANMIRTEELSEQQRKGLANVLSHLAAFSAEPAHWSGVDADKKLEMALQSAGIWKMDTPALQKIGAQFKRLAHILAAKHDGMLESNIRLLRKASDPDALILKTFRVSLAENHDGQMAAIRTARTFAIDIDDVVAVVREAAARRPKVVREAGEFTTSVGTDAAAPAAPPPQQAQPQATNQMGDGVPIFPVEQNQPAAMGATPSEPTGNAVQPNPMQPANQSQSTIKPQSPAAMRANQQQQKMAAMQQPTQPTGQQTQPRMAPQQPQQPQQPQRPQQPRQTPQLNLPGQAMTKSNPALRRVTTR
jgi:hypothetical protein